MRALRFFCLLLLALFLGQGTARAQVAALFAGSAKRPTPRYEWPYSLYDRGSLQDWIDKINEKYRNKAMPIAEARQRPSIVIGEGHEAVHLYEEEGKLRAASLALSAFDSPLAAAMKVVVDARAAAARTVAERRNDQVLQDLRREGRTMALVFPEGEDLGASLRIEGDGPGTVPASVMWKLDPKTGRNTRLTKLHDEFRNGVNDRERPYMDTLVQHPTEKNVYLWFPKPAWVLPGTEFEARYFPPIHKKSDTVLGDAWNYLVEALYYHEALVFKDADGNIFFGEITGPREGPGGFAYEPAHLVTEQSDPARYKWLMDALRTKRALLTGKGTIDREPPPEIWRSTFTCTDLIDYVGRFDTPRRRMRGNALLRQRDDLRRLNDELFRREMQRRELRDMRDRRPPDVRRP